MHTHSTQRVTITKFSTCTFKRKITDLDPSETQSPDASRRDKVQIPKPCFLLYFLPFHWIFLLNRVPFRHLLYESATFSFRGNPKEIYLVSKIFLILTKVLHTVPPAPPPPRPRPALETAKGVPPAAPGGGVPPAPPSPRPRPALETGKGDFDDRLPNKEYGRGWCD